MSKEVILKLTERDVNNLKETLDSIFQTIFEYNFYNEDEFDVECIDLSQGELETLVKIAKAIFTESKIKELNSNIDIPEAKIK